jgi:hypothetical protein
MRVFKDNEELKSLIVDGNIIIQDNIMCNFNIDVKANIKAWSIKSWDIKANDIDARNIDAWNIDVNASIKAWNIKAGDVSYYAFCVAYKDIECESVKGLRNNSFHKCLDGKLTIKEKLKQITIHGRTFRLNKKNIEDLKSQLK